MLNQVTSELQVSMSTPEQQMTPAQFSHLLKVPNRFSANLPNVYIINVLVIQITYLTFFGGVVLLSEVSVGVFFSYQSVL